MNWFSPENVSLVLFFIGLTGLILRRNMMISILSMTIMDAGIILFFLTINADIAGHVPLAVSYMDHLVDPIPHALMITSVVIGVAVKALAMIMVLNYYNHYKTLDWDVSKKIRDEEKYM
jgi:multicomponent Na+:H+ antiporter subunit C